MHPVFHYVLHLSLLATVFSKAKYKIVTQLVCGIGGIYTTCHLYFLGPKNRNDSWFIKWVITPIKQLDYELEISIAPCQNYKVLSN